jgi:dethiobiotin synthetase
MSKRYFITGIGTDVGKTIVSAILTEALQADYWKPIQSGTNDGYDSDTVKNLVQNTHSTFFKESYALKEPLSPHAAAGLEGVEIDMNEISVPVTSNTLLIEGAGGLLVPVNDTHYVSDLALHCQAEIILVISNYLGCINHSLLSIEYLKQKKYPVKGIILNGEFTNYTKSPIVKASPWKILAEIPSLNDLTKETIHHISKTITPF